MCHGFECRGWHDIFELKNDVCACCHDESLLDV